MTAYTTIEYEVDDGAAIVRLDRPDTLNAMSIELREELTEALQSAEANDSVRAVILTGNGRAFSSGYDFGDDNGETQTLETYMMDYDHDYLNVIYHLDVPVIAAVDGYALAGGTDLALYCDITLASENAEFGYPEIHSGSLPGRLVFPFTGCSIKHARELIYTGRHVSAEEAAQIGWANRVVDSDQLMAEAREMVEQIKLTPPSIVALSKTILNDAMEEMGFRPDGDLDDYIWAMSMMVESNERFREIMAEQGLEAAIEWMHNEPK